MKKVILILILFLSCYLIYNKTIDKKLNYLTVGDALSKGINAYNIQSYGYSDYIKDYLYTNGRLKEFNKTFTSSDYRLIDIIKILQYNEKKEEQSLIRLIKKADIITISLGMNEIYYKLDKNNQNMYSSIDKMINDYSVILTYINKFHHKQVYILGYYNVTGENQDIFDYANYKLKKLCEKNKVNFIDLSKTLANNPLYLSKTGTFIPNNRGYEKISQIIVEKIKNN